MKRAWFLLWLLSLVLPAGYALGKDKMCKSGGIYVPCEMVKPKQAPPAKKEKPSAQVQQDPLEDENKPPPALSPKEVKRCEKCDTDSVKAIAACGACDTMGVSTLRAACFVCVAQAATIRQTCREGCPPSS